MLTNIHDGAVDAREDSERHPGLIWFSEECLSNGAPLESYVIHAEASATASSLPSSAPARASVTVPCNACHRCLVRHGAYEIAPLTRYA